MGKNESQEQRYLGNENKHLIAEEYNLAIIKMLEKIEIEKNKKRIYKLVLYLYTQEADGY